MSEITVDQIGQIAIIVDDLAEAMSEISHA